MKSSALAAFIALVASVPGVSQQPNNWFPLSKFSGITVHCPDDKTRAELIAKAQKDDAEAEYILGSTYLSTCTGPNDVANGIQLLERSALQGNAHAAVALAEAYRNGKSGPADAVKAASWDERAAQSGDARGQNDFGVICRSGTGIARDEARAAKLFLAAAEQGLPQAEYNLATMYDQGTGVTQNYDTAVQWYLKAAGHKDADAEYRLGMIWEEGLGRGKDSEVALRWFKKAADDGSVDAQVRVGQKQPSESRTINSGYFQYIVGTRMLTGEGGLQKNEDRAIDFLKKSAEAGFPPAMVKLGQMFARGQAVHKDEAQAVKYFEQAIARDGKYHFAYNSLAWLYVTADDVKLRNPQKALEYATKAVELSEHKNAAEMDTLAHAYFQLGKLDDALTTEKAAAELDPKDQSIQKTLEEYKKTKENPPQK
ncbi:MAG TPA: hypothetical protein VKD65_00860 [Candidatus Angelobacter sp.]|nr:hypothetical protein [Candidatus Angelobacter sp.]